MAQKTATMWKERLSFELSETILGMLVKPYASFCANPK